MITVSSPVFALLLFVVVPVVRANSGDNLARKRREWILPPKPLKENVNYTHQESIVKIRSDVLDSGILYSLEGIGANQFPFNVFVVNPKTGFIRVTQVLDREYIDTYNLSGVATKSNGLDAERKIDIRIKVVDENDNAPKFGVIKNGEVDELSLAGTSVMKITATDADEPGNPNSQIAYSIIDQNPPNDMFHITKDGTILVNNPLDREKADQYTLTVKGQDLNGQSEGKSATSTVTINVRDVNDNLPTLEKEEYEGSIEENTEGVEVMRIKAKDLDQEATDNWEAVFDIIKGNEAEYFSIRTDPKTNEGILMLDKAVDYEDVKDLDLGLVVRNKAPFFNGSGVNTGAGIGFSGGGGEAGGAGGGGGEGGGGGAGGSGAGGVSGGSSWQSGSTFKTYPIKINVKDKQEGPHFHPKVKAIPISEEGHSINMKDAIAHYFALDGDTGKPAENVRYAKGSDPDNWLNIDPETAKITLNKIPDRESPYLVNGTYIAKVLCITDDMPSKTATGTVAIQVEDVNDHCPTLTNNIQTICTTVDAVIVSAKDEDAFPNGPPFDFIIVPEGTKGKWQVEHLNDTAAILRVQESVWPGFYEVKLVVKDEQGKACPEPQMVKVQVCTCEDGMVCAKHGANGGADFGAAGIGLLFLGLLLLALIPLLLLFCQCGGAAGVSGGFTEMPFDTKSHLINYHTEGQGENTEVPLLNMLPQMEGDMFNMGIGMVGKTSAMAPRATFDFQKSVTSMDGINRVHQDGFAGDHREETWGMMNQPSASGFHSEFEGRESGGGGGIYDGMALPDHFLEQYYTQKLDNGNKNLAVKNSLLVYDYEGQGSSAGSVGCCSLLESDDDLHFLDDLGPKFKTLAEVCGGKQILTEVKQVFTPAAMNTQTSVSRFVNDEPQLPPPTQLQPTVSNIEQTVVRDISERSDQMINETMTTKRREMANQDQMLLVQQQQPVYYTTTPRLQPTHYVVQPQIQNTMLLAEAPANNLQGMVLVNSTQTGPSPCMVVQGQVVMSSGQYQGPHVMLVESNGIQVDGTDRIYAGNICGSQIMMVEEDKVPAKSMKVVKGIQTCHIPGGTRQPGGLLRSQRGLVVGGPTSNGGQLVQEAEGVSEKCDVSGSMRVLCSESSTSSGSQNRVVGSSIMSSATPTYRKMVIQQTREIQ
ncbi:desmoglein-2-like [Hippoglossus stenolepis]|uniref:desmoglein-2-like n=1 Tax=Hippoglossus stenolepis TaxID=195615 RepID=UPI001FB01FEF|nr:desmoglein-2-like [Hippoglossus stenolepis]